MDYFYIVDINDKKVYSLGKKSECKYNLPYVAHIFENKEVVWFGDESHCFLEDKYMYEINEETGENLYEELKLDISNRDDEQLSKIEMSEEEFYDLFDEIGGKELNDFNKYLKVKYLKNKGDI